MAKAGRQLITVPDGFMDWLKLGADLSGSRSISHFIYQCTHQKLIDMFDGEFKAEGLKLDLDSLYKMTYPRAGGHRQKEAA